ncbi:hypothetical protein GCM10027275_23520 [Rhabdobacter roseus]|uniref:Uncharacterized protein n=1 Tax=Rhabdobacter roseus TaxID=1655419 RepID=A0A840TRV6_9BACT|nr:hypothetical protein [Rhabdobacter roseus]MBB5284292.1 hypothetical protein [Rhabdobacter roseus]
MKTTLTCVALLLASLGAHAQKVVPPAIQIKTAVLAAPSDKRDGALVYGYGTDGKFTVLRKGTNDLVCLADNPAQKDINVSCYHHTLEPFMARGRQLKQEGKSAQEIIEIREKEAKAGTLAMPKAPASLFVFSGTDDNYDTATGELKDGYLRYVVYIPLATAESTGLPLKPEAPGMPWIMDPGTHRAHIMINPPKK